MRRRLAVRLRQLGRLARPHVRWLDRISRQHEAQHHLARHPGRRLTGAGPQSCAAPRAAANDATDARAVAARPEAPYCTEEPERDQRRRVHGQASALGAHERRAVMAEVLRR